MGPADVAAAERMAMRIRETIALKATADGEQVMASKRRRDPELRRVEAELHASRAFAEAVGQRARADRAHKQAEVRRARERQAIAEADAENACENLRHERENCTLLKSSVASLEKDLAQSKKTIGGLKWQVDTLPSKGELRGVERKLALTEKQLGMARRSEAEQAERLQQAETAQLQQEERAKASRVLLEERLQSALNKNREASAKLKAQGQRMGGFLSRPAAATTPDSLQLGKHRARTTDANEVLLAAERRVDTNKTKNDLQQLRVRARSDEYSPQVLAGWLGKNNLRLIMDNTKAGSTVQMEIAERLKSVLQAQWDSSMAVTLKIDASLSDDQMDAARKAFSFMWDEQAGCFVKRPWLENPHSGVMVTFPEPIVSRHKWKPDFHTLCDKHKITSYDNGKVAERTAEECLILLIQRNYEHAHDKTLGLSPDHPICVSTSWDAVSWEHRKITHGGLKFASFGPGVSHQSELNYVTAGICNSDDGAGGQSFFLKRFAPEFNALSKRGVSSVPGLGAVHVKMTACTDMAFQRSACGRRSGSASHCECDQGKETRHAALHEPPKSNGTESYDEIARKFFSGCKLLTADRLLELSHLAKDGHDWSKGLWCSVCAKTIFNTHDEYKQFYEKLKSLQEKASGDKEASKELNKILDGHAASHFKQYLGPQPLQKTAFKYSWLDGIMDEQRPEMAQVLVDHGVAFDIRKKAKEGGERNDKEKWMKASKVNVFFDGRSKDELPEGGALPSVVFKLCDARYLDHDRTPLPLKEPATPPVDDPLEDSPPSAPAKAKAPAAAPQQFARPTKKVPKKSSVPLVPPPTAKARTAAADPLDLASYRSPTHMAYTGVDAELATALIERYKHWAPKVAYIVRTWRALSAMRSILKEPWSHRPTLEERKERAARFFHAAVDFWRGLEAISNSRHKSWYCHAWCLVLPRQIVECGDLWQHATCAIEFRGARITRQKVCWRPAQAQAEDRRMKRGDIITKFKQRYGSDPMTQLLRNICSLEELRSSAGSKGVKANRLKLTGRSKPMKLEAKSGCKETSFGLFNDMLQEMNATAGADT